MQIEKIRKIIYWKQLHWRNRIEQVIHPQPIVLYTFRLLSNDTESNRITDFHRRKINQMA